jgi:hypothetical protein
MRMSGRFARVKGPGRTESRGVVGFEVILGGYSPLSMAALGSVSLAVLSSAIDVSER